MRSRLAGWMVPALLAVPFVVTIAALRGLTITLPTFHGSDEWVYIVPTILRFGRELPRPDLHAYHAAQTPLFFLVMAVLGKVVGYAVWRLRLLNALISYLLALSVYRLLRRCSGLAREEALVLSALFLLSPYVFGSSFRVLTDNLAVLFVVLGVERLERFRQTGRPGPFLGACLCAGAAVLTRQSAAYVLALAALYAVRPDTALPGRRRLALLAAVAAAALPAGILFLSWRGLVPVGGDTSSCGLCAAGRTSGSRVVEVPTAELALATIGLYGAVLLAPLLWRVRPTRRRCGVALAGAAAGALLLLGFPASPGAHAAGYLWQASVHLPSVLGTSLLFWVLVPTAGAILALRLPGAPSRFLAVAYLACFLVSALVIRYPWQKYVDPFAMLSLLLTIRPGELSRRLALAGAALLAAGFIAYTVDFSAHADTLAGGVSVQALTRAGVGGS